VLGGFPNVQNTKFLGSFGLDYFVLAEGCIPFTKSRNNFANNYIGGPIYRVAGGGGQQTGYLCHRYSVQNPRQTCGQPSIISHKYKLRTRFEILAVTLMNLNLVSPSPVPCTT
jgi:hypothetical protein